MGGDELNLIKPNTNYGWPAVTFGINYDGTPITPDTSLPGMELPLTYWVPSIAPSGMTFIKNGQPNNEADILMGALAGKHIHWVKLEDNIKVASSQSMNNYARFRDVRQAPDGKVYAMTEAPNSFVRLRVSGLNSISASNNNTEDTEKSAIHPNPSFGESTLSFYVENNQFVSVNVFSSGGTLLGNLVAKPFSNGTHVLPLNTEKWPAGLYYVEINKGGLKSILNYIKL